MNLQLRITTSVFAVLLVIGIGTLGYHLIEDWNFLESFYMTMITISTVGFGEIHTLTLAGRILTIILIISAITIGTYALTNLTSYIVSGEIFHRFRYRRMQRKIDNLNGHVIVAGFGKLGREIAEELNRMEADFCVVEFDPEHVDQADQLEYLVIEGDASRDDVLERAGVKRAYGLIAALTGDGANVMVTITAREMNPDLYIVARGIDKHSEAKLRRAGADRVELPFKISGRRLSTLILKPGFVDFIDLFSRTFADQLHMVQMEVQEDSTLCDKALKDIDLRRKTGGLVIMSILRETGDLVVHPDGDVIIHKNDRLLVLGTDEQIARFRREFKVSEAPAHDHFHRDYTKVKHGVRGHDQER